MNEISEWLIKTLQQNTAKENQCCFTIETIMIVFKNYIMLHVNKKQIQKEYTQMFPQLSLIKFTVMKCLEINFKFSITRNKMLLEISIKFLQYRNKFGLVQIYFLWIQATFSLTFHGTEKLNHFMGIKMAITTFLFFNILSRTVYLS